MHVWTSSLLSFLGAWNDASARNVAAELGLRRRLGRPRRSTGRHLPTGLAVTCAALQRGTRQSRPSARPGAAAGVDCSGHGAPNYARDLHPINDDNLNFKKTTGFERD